MEITASSSRKERPAPSTSAAPSSTRLPRSISRYVCRATTTIAGKGSQLTIVCFIHRAGYPAGDGGVFLFLDEAFDFERWVPAAKAALTGRAWVPFYLICESTCLPAHQPLLIACSQAASDIEHTSNVNAANFDGFSTQGSVPKLIREQMIALNTVYEQRQCTSNRPHGWEGYSPHKHTDLMYLPPNAHHHLTHSHSLTLAYPTLPFDSV